MYFGLSSVEWFVDEMIKLEIKAKFSFDNTNTNLIMQEENEENVIKLQNVRFLINLSHHCLDYLIWMRKFRQKGRDYCHLTGETSRSG